MSRGGDLVVAAVRSGPKPLLAVGVFVEVASPADDFVGG